MRRSRLDVPQRLARQAVDQARLELAGTAAARQGLERSLAGVREARAQETFGDVRALALVAAYRERCREIERELVERLREAVAREADLRRCLGERRCALRRLELLHERQRARARQEAARRDRRELENLVVMRYGRTGR